MLRESILVQLKKTIHAKSLQTLRMGCRHAGFDLEEKALEVELEYLAGKGFVKFETSELSHGVRNFRITASGVDYIESQGY